MARKQRAETRYGETHTIRDGVHEGKPQPASKGITSDVYEEALARVRGQAGNSLFISLRILRNCVSSRWSSSSRKTVQRLRSSLTVIMTKALEDGHAQFVARSAEDLTLTCVPLTQWRRGPWGSAWSPADTRLVMRIELRFSEIRARARFQVSVRFQSASVDRNLSLAITMFSDL